MSQARKARARTRPQPQSGSALANDPLNDLTLAIQYTPPGELSAPARALRNAPERQKAALRTSITEFGFLSPILIDGGGRIICGRARWLAALDLGLKTVPVIIADHLTDEQKRLYSIAENRLGELGEWDEAELSLEFGELALNLDLDLELTGFSMSEIDDMIVDAIDEEQEPLFERSMHLPVSRIGEVWTLGDHRLACGDALTAQVYASLMGGHRAQLVFSDPPYNQPMKAISGKGKNSHSEFAMASGEMSPREFTDFLHAVFKLAADHSQQGSIHFMCMDWHHMREMLDAGEAVYTELKNLIVWNKGSGGMGTFYRSQHELIFAWKSGEAKHINNFKLGETGRFRTNVWDYRGNNSFHAGRDEELAAHPTVKPVALIMDAIRDCSHRGGIVLDPFGGSGSTLIAAERCGRRARLIEIDPGYCDHTIERWQQLTGAEARLEGGGSWREVAEARGIELDAEQAEGGA